MYGEISWWMRRLVEHHNSYAKAFDAQVHHLGAEYGELLREIANYHGDNPRRPEDPEKDPENMMDELADVCITALITMAIARELYFHDRQKYDNPIANTINKLEARFAYVTDRMQEFDDVKPPF